MDVGVDVDKLDRLVGVINNTNVKFNANGLGKINKIVRRQKYINLIYSDYC